VFGHEKGSFTGAQRQHQGFFERAHGGTLFLEEISQREGKSKSFTPAGLRRMASYPWPGNVRELRNAVHRAYVMTEGALISDEWLPQAEVGTPLPAASSGRSLSVHVGMSLAEVERMMIYATLDHYGGHKEKTAATLGVSLKTLYNRLKEYAEESARPEASEV
jgi:DNA-binding NtrC family response regulator